MKACKASTVAGPGIQLIAARDGGCVRHRALAALSKLTQWLY